MKVIFKEVKETDDSGSQNADEKQEREKQTEQMSAVNKIKIFDWENVNFGFLHSKIIKKIFGFLSENYTTGKWK